MAAKQVVFQNLKNSKFNLLLSLFKRTDSSENLPLGIGVETARICWKAVACNRAVEVCGRKIIIIAAGV